MSDCGGNPDMFRFMETGVLSDGELELRLALNAPGDKDTVPAYHFDLRLGQRRIGGIRFRVASTPDIKLYAGNLGYNVDPEFRGRRFAERACRLLIPLARAHRFDHLWITCDPDNHASRITCERLGAVLVETIVLPEDLDMYQDGEREKCRYRLDLHSLSGTAA